ncbi:Calcineurin-like_phosphoesterase domain-containing protein [Hexamita inflata]|uniref:Calcineurin-like phosphoesterase domain-containing protein n=1 Tax=Hexamita inflata TaxID=28002 RepID=A0AA86PN88_9EUKA|nr:Calcineurin-like phosphoesterase domain-containing protein [Hexamita inflata]
MKFITFTDSHIGYKQSIEQTFKQFEECLFIARQERPDFVLYLGDMFDIKHPDASYIRRVRDLLLKYNFRPLADELLFPSEEYVYQVHTENQSVPFLQICGNHEDRAVLDLLPTQKFNSRFDSKIIPYILQFGAQILVLYAVDYDKHLNQNLKLNTTSLVPPTKFFAKYPDLAQDVSCLFAMHQDNCKLTSLFDFSFLQSFNQLNKHQINFVLNGHEHAFDQMDKYEGTELHVTQPGSFTITKRQIELSGLVKNANQHLMICELNQNRLLFKTRQLFTFQIVCKLDVTVDCTKIHAKAAYVKNVETQLNEFLDKVIEWYQNQDFITLCYAAQLNNIQEPKEYIMKLQQTLKKGDKSEVFEFIPKPVARIIVKPSNFDYSMGQILKELILDDELAQFKPFFDQKRLVEVHQIDIKPQKIQQNEIQLQNEPEQREPRLKTLQFEPEELKMLHKFVNTELETIHKAQQDEGNVKASSANTTQKAIDDLIQKEANQIKKVIEDAAGTDEFEDILIKLCDIKVKQAEEDDESSLEVVPVKKTKKAKN